MTATANPIVADVAIQSDGTNARTIDHALSARHTVYDKSAGSFLIALDNLRLGEPALVNPGDWVVQLTLAGRTLLLVLTDAQYQALFTIT